MDEIKMRVSGVEKSFPGVKALSGIDFAVRKGTVHALCGENGAGNRSCLTQSDQVEEHKAIDT